MMKKLFISLCIFICAKSTAQLLFKVQGDSLIAYNYYGGDEFNTPRINTNDWTLGMGWTRVLMSQEVAFSPLKIKLENGILNLETNLEDSTYILTPWEVDSNMIKKEKYVLVDSKFRTKYASASIISKRKYHYGLYELRFKVDEGKGLWPAFWFFGGNKNEEIDAFELKCEKNDYIHVDTHCPYGCDHGYKNKLGFNTSWGDWMPVSDYLHNGYNVMGLEWKPNEVIWYINGQPLAYFKGAFANPMNLYINNNVAADGRAFGPGPDKSTVWPNKFLVDYVRVWRQTNSSATSVLEPNDLLTVPTVDNANPVTPQRKRGLMYRKDKLKALDGMIFLNLDKNHNLTVMLSGEIGKAPYTAQVKIKETVYSFDTNTTKMNVMLDGSEKKLEIIIKNKKSEIRKEVLIQQ